MFEPLRTGGLPNRRWARPFAALGARFCTRAIYSKNGSGEIWNYAVWHSHQFRPTVSKSDYRAKVRVTATTRIP